MQFQRYELHFFVRFFSFCDTLLLWRTPLPRGVEMKWDIGLTSIIVIFRVPSFLLVTIISSEWFMNSVWSEPGEAIEMSYQRCTVPFHWIMHTFASGSIITSYTSRWWRNDFGTWYVSVGVFEWTSMWWIAHPLLIDKFTCIHWNTLADISYRHRCLLTNGELVIYTQHRHDMRFYATFLYITARHCSSIWSISR